MCGLRAHPLVDYRKMFRICWLTAHLLCKKLKMRIDTDADRIPTDYSFYNKAFLLIWHKIIKCERLESFRWSYQWSCKRWMVELREHYIWCKRRQTDCRSIMSYCCGRRSLIKFRGLMQTQNFWNPHISDTDDLLEQLPVIDYI